MTRKLTFYRWIDSAGVLWNSFPSPLICKVRFDQRKQTWAIRWCCSLMTLETAICMLSNIATTSRILSSNDGAANIWKETLHYISPDEVKVYMKWHISNVNSVIYILKQKFRKIVKNCSVSSNIPIKIFIENIRTWICKHWWFLIISVSRVHGLKSHLCYFLCELNVSFFTGKI